MLGLLAFATETSLVYLLTLYLQKTLGFTPLTAGVTFGVLGIGTVLGGLAAPKAIARTSTLTALVGGGLLQAVATAALLFLGTTTGAARGLLLLPATFLGGVGNMLVIVGFMVTATSDLPDAEQGLATGLASMSQQVGITMGTPVMSAVVTAGTAGATTHHRDPPRSHHRHRGRHRTRPPRHRPGRALPPHPHAAGHDARLTPPPGRCTRTPDRTSRRPGPPDPETSGSRHLPGPGRTGTPQPPPRCPHFRVTSPSCATAPRPDTDRSPA